MGLAGLGSEWSGLAGMEWMGVARMGLDGWQARLGKEWRGLARMAGVDLMFEVR